MTRIIGKGEPGSLGEKGYPGTMGGGQGGAGGRGGSGGDSVDFSEDIRSLNQRLAAIEIDGSPNMRERVSKLEGRIEHLIDPERGIYSALYKSQERLRTWAIVILTILLGNMLMILLHVLSGDRIP